MYRKISLSIFSVDDVKTMSLQESPSEIASNQRFPSNSPHRFRQKQVWKDLGNFHYCRNAPARTIPEHDHSNHALLISLSGTIWLNMPSNGYRQLQKLPLGGIAITPAKVMHSAIVDEGSEFIILHLNPEFVTKSVYGFLRQHQSALKPLLVQSDPLIQSIGTTLKTEIEFAQCDRFYTESLLSALSVHLLKRYTTSKQTLQKRNSKLSSQKLSYALSYIDAHLCDAIQLEDLANVLHMSRYYFCRLFKQSVGITPYQYLLQQRVERAKQLLQRQELSLVDVALACGFANQSHFTKHFKQQTGVTPRAYLISSDDNRS